MRSLPSDESNEVEGHGYADYNGEQNKNYNYRLKEYNVAL